MTRNEVFGIVFVVVALWEAGWPALTLSGSLVGRWVANGGLFLIDRVLMSLVTRALPVAVAAAGAVGSGPLGKMPFWAQGVLTLLVLDLAGYARHRWYHASAALWRIHEPHHSDVDCDLSTSFRFHPVEAAIGTLTSLAGVWLLAAPASAVALYEGLAMMIGLTGHGNIRLPGWLERAVALVFITPGLHRTHHSTETAGQLSNYGIVFSWWDWVFRTLRDEPTPAQFGLPGQRGPATWSLWRLLIAPLDGSRRANGSD